MKKDADDPGRLPLKIAILYSDAKREYFPTDEQYLTEAEVYPRAQLVSQILRDLHYEVGLFPGDSNLSQNIKKFSPHFVINLVDSIYGKEYLSASIPATLELLNLPYTGTGIMGKTIDSNKFFTKNLLYQYGITTPKYQLVTDVNDVINSNLDYPLIAKLNEIHGGVEINDSAICYTEKKLRKRLDFLISTYHQPVLVEEYIAGKEITVILLEGSNTKIYTGQKIFRKDVGKHKIVSFEANWLDEGHLITYKKYRLPDPIKKTIKLAFDILKMEDYAKFDIRVDDSGRHYFIDCNANPALGPKESGCAISSVLALYGIDFTEILRRLIINTLDGNHPL